MHQKKNIPFKIESIDSLGQGVSKTTDKITFIPKTLPGEVGIAEVRGHKKNVQFAELTELQQTAKERISPDCLHYTNCPSCHFLHTSYENELNFKLQNLERMFFKIEHPPIKSHAAVRRFHYRNRIQLHFDTKIKKLGMLDAKNQQIAPIPQCMIPVDLVKQELMRLYDQDSWLKIIPKNSPQQGHLEIYEKNGVVKIAVNKPYADGGFTQVFSEMNLYLQNLLKDELKTNENTKLLDLFAGDGNLSNNLNHSKRLCIDFYSHSVAFPFYSLDLYSPDALQKTKRLLKENALHPDLLLVDPPRSGLKNLQEWIEDIQPQKVVYVSCDPHTLVRDLSKIDTYLVKGLHLVDLFPSTFHFETVVFLERK
jgi:23S rRNA (uracil1939-C5)-methyltransferase